MIMKKTMAQHSILKHMICLAFLHVVSINACIRSSQDDVKSRTPGGKLRDPDNILDNAGSYGEYSANLCGTQLTNDDDSSYVYTANYLPKDARLRPSVSNGHIGTVAHTKVLHMNGVYNGYRTNSHRAIIPAPFNVKVTGVHPGIKLSSTYTVDAKRGIYYETHQGENISVIHTLYAHRTIVPLVVVQLEVFMSHIKAEDTRISLKVSGFRKSPDITFTEKHLTDLPNARYQFGKIKVPETETSDRTRVHIIYDMIPEELIVPHSASHVTWTFLTAIHVTKSQAVQAYKQGKSLLERGNLLCTHIRGWQDLWRKGRIEINGDDRLSKITISSLFYILSSIPLENDSKWPYIGLSPNGLPWGSKGVDYLGHVFWDQDTWMFPGILPLHSDLAQILLSTRRRTLTAARENAKLNNHTGVQYPWESAFSGVEVSPSATCATQELHVNGDIVLAIMQYVWLTGDQDILIEGPYREIITGIADFWISKLTFNVRQRKYEILGIMGPDEYHDGVNNSVYTNAIAQFTLNAAADITGGLRSKYKHFADNMYIPYDVENQYHPEYNGYNLGTVIKQADAVLLGFPLLYNMTHNQRLNDLLIYEKVTDPQGPAMTWCMHAIGWLELGNLKKAEENLKKTYGNVASPFMVWTEVPEKQGAPNFLTGQGGFIQAILYGFMGLRIHNNKLDINCTLPSNVTSLAVRGLDYLGSVLDVVCSEFNLDVIMTKAGEYDLFLVDGSQRWLLSCGNQLTIQTHRVYFTGAMKLKSVQSEHDYAEDNY